MPLDHEIEYETKILPTREKTTPTVSKKGIGVLFNIKIIQLPFDFLPYMKYYRCCAREN